MQLPKNSGVAQKDTTCMWVVLWAHKFAVREVHKPNESIKRDFVQLPKYSRSCTKGYHVSARWWSIGINPILGDNWWEAYLKLLTPIWEGFVQLWKKSISCTKRILLFHRVGLWAHKFHAREVHINPRSFCATYRLFPKLHKRIPRVMWVVYYELMHDGLLVSIPY